MSESTFKQPYTRSAAYCPDCGDPLMVVTRVTERATHSAPLVYSCVRCKSSWSIPAAALDCAKVDFDNGQR